VRKLLLKSYQQDAPERHANQLRMQRLAHRLTPEVPGAMLAQGAPCFKRVFSLLTQEKSYAGAGARKGRRSDFFATKAASNRDHRS
jgi:hypothetical protein